MVDGKGWVFFKNGKDLLVEKTCWWKRLVGGKDLLFLVILFFVFQKWKRIDILSFLVY
jgi:hypothetical protein